MAGAGSVAAGKPGFRVWCDDHHCSIDPEVTSLMAIQLSGKKLIGLAIGALILVRLLIALIPVRLHISPETTVISSPLRADGTPDYAAYLNDEWSAGVTPENNAAVDLIRAFGPEIINELIRKEYFDLLGIPVPEGPALFVEFRDYLLAEGIAERHQSDRVVDLEEKAARARNEPWTTEDYPEVAAWVDANEAAVAAIVDASQRPRFFSPLVSSHHDNLLDVLLPVVQQSRSGVRLLMTQAMHELGNANAQRACELTLACHRLSRLLSEHPTMIGRLVAHAIAANANSGDQAIVLSGLLAKEQAIAYRTELDALPPWRPLAEAIDRYERFMSLDATIATYTGRISEEDLGLPPQALKWVFDPNPILHQFNQAYDEIDSALSVADRTKRNRALADIDQRRSNVERPPIWVFGLAMMIGSRAMISEYVGQVTVSVMLPAVAPAVHAEERAHVRLLLTDVGYALAAYNADHGAFPDSLDALVPDLLPAVPLDPFTGDPLRYELKGDGFLLYSVGANGRDDGGLMDGRQNTDDIAFGVTPEPDDGD
jgi:hypothetical protein